MRTLGIGHLALGIILLLHASAPRASAQTGCPADEPRASAHIRALDEPMAAALRDGLRRSPTFGRLVQRVDELNGRVLLEGHPIRLQGHDSHLVGVMSHAINVTSDFRLIRVVVQPRRGDATIATLAHELRHVIEVLEDEKAVDVISVDRLYDRIGTQTRSGVYETRAAAVAGERVLAELRRCRT